MGKNVIKSLIIEYQQFVDKITLIERDIFRCNGTDQGTTRISCPASKRFLTSCRILPCCPGNAFP